MTDHITRALLPGANLRALACITTHTVTEACRRHQPAPTAAVALGRALSAGALMGALLKGRERVALKWEGNGPLKKIVVQADAQGRVQGYVANPQVDLPLRQGRFDIAGALGQAGILTVTKDLLLKTPYQGIVHLISSEIGEDLAYYLGESEQIPSAVGLTCIPDGQGGIAVAGGFLIQSLPPADPAMVEEVSRRIEELPPLGRILLDNPSAKALLSRIFAGLDLEILETREVAFACSCSRERTLQALRALGPEEIRNLIARGKEVHMTCEFCRQEYIFSPEELKTIEEGSAS